MFLFNLINWLQLQYDEARDLRDCKAFLRLELSLPDLLGNLTPGWNEEDLAVSITRFEGEDRLRFRVFLEDTMVLQMKPVSGLLSCSSYVLDVCLGMIAVPVQEAEVETSTEETTQVVEYSPRLYHDAPMDPYPQLMILSQRTVEALNNLAMDGSFSYRITGPTSSHIIYTSSLSSKEAFSWSKCNLLTELMSFRATFFDVATKVGEHLQHTKAIEEEFNVPTHDKD